MPKAAQASLFDAAFDPIPAPAPAAVASLIPAAGGYSAKDIEVLEGLEPVRMRPGMYIGGIDERALHHLFAEVLDNSMDEAVAGHAKVIEVSLAADGALTVRDDGRGMPVDPHPKFPGKSAMEVILTVLHSGGKFSGKAYETSGGLHGVGVSVVNALSETLEINVWKDGFEWRQSYSRGKPLGPLEKLGATRKHGTAVTFRPDPEIFKEGAAFRPARLHRMAKSKAYLFRGVEIRWKCAPERIHDETPQEAVFRFPGGLRRPRRSGRGPGDGDAHTLHRAHRTQRRGRRRGMGGDLDAGGFWRGRWLHALLLQHGPHPRGRDPRGRASRRPHPGPQGLGRPHQ